MKTSRKSILAVTAAIVVATGATWRTSMFAQEPNTELRAEVPDYRVRPEHEDELRVGAEGGQFVAKPFDEVPHDVLFFRSPNPERGPNDEEQTVLQRYAKTTDAEERERIKTRLKAIVADQFFARQQQRLRELQELEAQVQRLRGVHERREQEKERIIGDRVEQLLRNADGVGWGDGRDVTRFVAPTPGASWNVPLHNPNQPGRSTDPSSMRRPFGPRRVEYRFEPAEGGPALRNNQYVPPPGPYSTAPEPAARPGNAYPKPDPNATGREDSPTYAPATIPVVPAVPGPPVAVPPVAPTAPPSAAPAPGGLPATAPPGDVQKF